MNSTDSTPASPSKAHRRSSPSSIDSHGPSASPFLHNLTRRLRKGSNASHASSASSDPPAPPHDPANRADSSKSSRRFLLSIIRDDWDYPPAAVSDDSHLTPREPIGYCRRYEAPSDIDDEEARSQGRSRSDPYKFESPDAVAAVLTEHTLTRRRLLEDEMSWNDGLRVWAQRRDAWTGAVKRKPPTTTAAVAPASSSSLKFHNVKGAHSSPSRSFIHHRKRSDTTEDDGSTTRAWPAHSPTPATPELQSLSAGSLDSAEKDDDLEPWLPIFPPLLPESNVARARIKPSAYATIYSKVVVQSLTPNVPIPLTHMVAALVEGWKSEGNWPPQPGAALPQDAKKGKSHGSAFLKWRKEQHEGKGGAEQGRVRRSLDMVKKVFGVGEDSGEDLGISFREQDEEEMEENITLNRGLLDHRP